MKWLLLLVLTGCAATAHPKPQAPEMFTKASVPPCKPAAAVVPVPGQPRNIDTLVAYANALRSALTATEVARADCARRYNRDVMDQ